MTEAPKLGPAALKELAAKVGAMFGPHPWKVRDEDPDWVVVVDDEFDGPSGWTPVAELHGDESTTADFIAAMSPERVTALVNLWETVQATHDGEICDDPDNCSIVIALTKLEELP
jgi:hypothetical protein